MSFDLFFLSSESIIEGKSKLNVVNFLPNKRRNITHVSKITILQYFEIEQDNSNLVEADVFLNHKISTLHFFEVVCLN